MQKILKIKINKCIKNNFSNKEKINIFNLLQEITTLEDSIRLEKDYCLIFKIISKRLFITEKIILEKILIEHLDKTDYLLFTLED